MNKYSPYSELKIFHHTDRIEGLLNRQRVAPVYVRIKPTNVCNQNCFSADMQMIPCMMGEK